MATLLETLQIEQVAFRWGGVTRVYRASKLIVDGEEEQENFVFADHTKGWTFDGIWLSFSVMSDHFERVSPEGAAGNDWIDVLNALNDPAVDVEFYPIWSLDELISYQVKKAPGRTRLLETRKTLFSASAAIRLEAVSIENEYPAWLRTTREKTL